MSAVSARLRTPDVYDTTTDTSASVHHKQRVNETHHRCIQNRAGAHVDASKDRAHMGKVRAIEARHRDVRAHDAHPRVRVVSVEVPVVQDASLCGLARPETDPKILSCTETSAWCSAGLQQHLRSPGMKLKLSKVNLRTSSWRSIMRNACRYTF